MNINLLMQQAQKMQKEMAKAQKELNEKLFELDSSGGAVHLSIYGNRKIEKITIDPEAIDPEEKEMLEEMNKKHKPERVVIEYNGMWQVSEFEKMKLPAGWAIEQKITTVDASTFQMYLTNLKPLFVEMVKGAELVLFNRCEDKKPLAGYRRSVKVVSPQAEVIFEDENGEVDNIFEDEVPYDLKAPVMRFQEKIMVSGIWMCLKDRKYTQVRR